MKVLLGRRRVALAVILTAALAGLAAGFAVARAHSGTALAQGSPRLVAKGTFRSLTWNTEGTASLVREPSGDLRLRLGKDFTTKRAPELYVYLAKLGGQRRTYWKEVGTLETSQGAQDYPVSEAATAPGIQVAIYCAKCNKISGVARLQAVGNAG